MNTLTRNLERFGVILVVLHLIISLAHGFAHTSLHIDLILWQKVYVLLVITVMPLTSGYLLGRHMRGGFVLLATSMLGALVFGGFYHFIAAGDDNVASLGAGAWAKTFCVTAVLLAGTETVGVLTGVMGILKR